MIALGRKKINVHFNCLPGLTFHLRHNSNCLIWILFTLLKIVTLEVTHVSAICILYLPQFSTTGSSAAYDHAFKCENGSEKHLSAILRYLLKVLVTFYGSYFLNNRKKFLLYILMKETPLLI